jgi:hypothetical protein
MTEPETTNRRRTILVVVGALALVVAGILALSGGDSGSGAEPTTTALSVAPAVTPPTSGIPVSTTVLSATSIPGAAIPGTTIPRPRIPGATTIPLPITAAPITAAPITVPVPDPRATITPDRNFLYDGTLDCPQQSVDFTMTVSDLPPGTTAEVYYQTNFGDHPATVLGGDRYRIPRQNTTPAAQGYRITVWVSWVEFGVRIGSAPIDYIDGAFPPCTP